MARCTSSRQQWLHISSSGGVGRGHTGIAIESGDSVAATKSLSEATIECPAAICPPTTPLPPPSSFHERRMDNPIRRQHWPPVLLNYSAAIIRAIVALEGEKYTLNFCCSRCSCSHSSPPPTTSLSPTSHLDPASVNPLLLCRLLCSIGYCLLQRQRRR